MASPPNHSPATSPPYPSYSSLPNPKKRPSLTVPARPASVKRQKRSSVVSATSAHPLRQTSFPPEESAIDLGARSPSVDSDVTGVTRGGSVLTNGTIKRTRGRGKSKKVDSSVRSGGRQGNADVHRREMSEVPDDDDDDEDDGGQVMEDDAEAIDEESEKKKLAVLLGAFNQDLEERYGAFRRVKLRKETVRKITNQTVSQSVPPTVITTINGYTKTFIGTLIERARDVQEQWSTLETPPPSPTKIPIDPTDFHAENPNNEIFATVNSTSVLADLTAVAPSVGKQAKESSNPQELGPLLPDHFREALRRYKRDGEAGGTGLAGVSVGLGLPGTGSARLGGKRLFK